MNCMYLEAVLGLTIGSLFPPRSRGVGELYADWVETLSSWWHPETKSHLVMGAADAYVRSHSFYPSPSGYAASVARFGSGLEREIKDLDRVVSTIAFVVFLVWWTWVMFNPLIDLRTPEANKDLPGRAAQLLEPLWVSGETRLRRRSRFLNRLSDELELERGLLGKILRGRWTPDLPSGDHTQGTRDLLGMLSSGARVLGGGLVRKTPMPEDAVDDAGAPKPDHLWWENVSYLRLDYQGCEVMILVPLFHALTVRAAYLKRDSKVVLNLKSRAIEWCRARFVAPEHVAACVPGTVALAMVRHNPEEDGERIMSLVSFGWWERLLGCSLSWRPNRWWSGTE